MRILIVHNAYQQPGGEDAVVADEVQLLREHGQCVATHIISNDALKDHLAKVSAAFSVGYSRIALSAMREKLKEFTPDVVHVHNTFPLLTPSIYDAFDEARVPIVQTLHNYRIGCINGTLMRAGSVCEKCWNGWPYWGAVHRCYRNSHLGSLAASIGFARNRRADTWNRKVTYFIALTEFARKKFQGFGIAADKILVKSNFTADPGTPNADRRLGALFVGRLSQEKGILQLVEAWRDIRYPLTIIGDGPLYNRLKEIAPPQITLAGRLSASEVRSHMREASFLLMPSLWYEAFPKVVVEAFACGLAVLASQIGSMSELILDGVTGLHFRPGDIANMRAKIGWAIHHPAEVSEMCRRARAQYESSYTPEINYRELIRIYQGAQAASASAE